MKNYLILILLLMITILVGPVKASLPLVGHLIVIDPGHGSHDPGTVVGTLFEKDLNLKISQKLEKELSRLGASVLLTRTGDYDLSSAHAVWRKKSDFDNRIKFINESGANFYVSIHINYLSDSSYSGIQVFAIPAHLEIARQVQHWLNQSLDSKRDAHLIPSKMYMYDKLKVKGLLIECGFLSNQAERRLLTTEEYQQKVAIAIAQALAKTLDDKI